MDTIDSLTTEYKTWLETNKLPKLSADELIVQTKTGDFAETEDDFIATEPQRIWLYEFNKRWERAEF